LFRGSAVSYDAGQTWTEIEKDASKAACRFFDATTGYAGGFFLTGPPLRGGIYKSEISFQPLPAQNIHTLISKDNQENNKEIIDASVNIYPTPAKDIVNISMDDQLISQPVSITIVTMDGKQIQSSKSTGVKTIAIDISKLPKGIYVVNISTGKRVINKTITIVR
jgi:hypothetical protein